MGQRFQIVVSTPPIYYNKANPNNRDRQLFVYHCQWLYGEGAMAFTHDLIESMKTKMEADRKHLSHQNPIGYNGYLDASIKHASTLRFFPNPLRISRYFGTSEHGEPDDDNQNIAQEKSWKKFLDSLDNNNGVLFIRISKDFRFKVCFYNPIVAESQESRKGKSIKADEYMKDYTPENEHLRASTLSALGYLKRIPFCDILKEKFPKGSETK